MVIFLNAVYKKSLIPMPCFLLGRREGILFCNPKVGTLKTLPMRWFSSSVINTHYGNFENFLTVSLGENSKRPQNNSIWGIGKGFYLTNRNKGLYFQIWALKSNCYENRLESKNKTTEAKLQIRRKVPCFV